MGVGGRQRPPFMDGHEPPVHGEQRSFSHEWLHPYTLGNAPRHPIYTRTPPYPRPLSVNVISRAKNREAEKTFAPKRSAERSEDYSR